MADAAPHHDPERPGLTGAEREELAALRVRAYAADSDIRSDPAALLRLDELEELVRRSRLDQADAGALGAVAGSVGHVPTPDAADSPEPDDVATSTVLRSDARPSPARWHARLVAGAGALALTLGFAAWGLSGTVEAPTAGAIPDVEDKPWSSAAIGYSEHLDERRELLLAGAESSIFAGRLIRAELQPLGTARGLSVWSGPTIDGAVCLVLAGETAPVIACNTPEAAAAGALSIDVSTEVTRDDETLEITGPEVVRLTLGADGMLAASEPD